MKKFLATLTATALAVVIASPVMAATHSAKTVGAIQPNGYTGVFFTSTLDGTGKDPTMSKWGTMGAYFDAWWYGGNGYYVATCYYNENSQSGNYNGNATYNRWSYYYNTAGSHYGYLTLGSGGYTDSSSTNSLTY